MIEFECEKCHEWIRVGDEMAGAKGRCGGCEAPIEAPNAYGVGGLPSVRPRSLPALQPGEFGKFLAERDATGGRYRGGFEGGRTIIASLAAGAVILTGLSVGLFAWNNSSEHRARKANVIPESVRRAILAEQEEARAKAAREAKAKGVITGLASIPPAAPAATPLPKREPIGIPRPGTPEARTPRDAAPPSTVAPVATRVAPTGTITAVNAPLPEPDPDPRPEPEWSGGKFGQAWFHKSDPATWLASLDANLALKGDAPKVEAIRPKLRRVDQAHVEDERSIAMTAIRAVATASESGLALRCSTLLDASMAVLPQGQARGSVAHSFASFAAAYVDIRLTDGIDDREAIESMRFVRVDKPAARPAPVPAAAAALAAAQRLLDEGRKAEAIPAFQAVIDNHPGATLEVAIAKTRLLILKAPPAKVPPPVRVAPRA